MMPLADRLKYHAGILDGIRDARERQACPQTSWTVLESRVIRLELDDLERVTREQDEAERIAPKARKFFNL